MNETRLPTCRKQSIRYTIPFPINARKIIKLLNFNKIYSNVTLILFCSQDIDIILKCNIKILYCHKHLVPDKFNEIIS